ncbi:bacteriocin-type signal sequence [Caldicellulosiruptor saccharolyticus DSM 8903]|uniref:Bacteriocin-type signal sequence n=1 Tax=Caldicellulosiruptor saccharolyticus (strain ATCC 43494 / DSM 8903 / Tp8T 6331) TaxID=351627 RepID=G2JCE9_CALS8|nr:hypothetical protein [Caldicellulosiruptor saccharolyticus]AEN71899.1 bacteriocin-type signal sequence [Caldicellulosiruptor saccharolyticus DSM 8903]
MNKFIQINKNELIKINGGAEEDYKFGYSVGYHLGKAYKWIANLIESIFYTLNGIPVSDLYYRG